MAILLLDERTNDLVARAARGLEEEVERGFRLPVGRGFAGRVAATGAPVTIRRLRPGDAVNPLLYERKIVSLLGVPLLVEGRVVGVLHVGSLTERDFGDDDTELLQVAADRAALAIDHARLFESERRARTAAEAALERLRQMQSLTEAALAYLELDELLAVMLDRTTVILDVDTAAVLLLEADGRTLAARAAKGLEEEVERGFRLSVGEGFAGRVAAERRPVAVEVQPGVVVNPLMFEKGVKRLLGVPMIVERRLIGVLHVGTMHERVFTENDEQLLQLVADRVALAIEHDRLFEQRRVAETLQRTLLPTVLDAPQGVRVAARYLPAAEHSAVGGDWYDLIPLPDGRVGIAIGDVVGHGLAAATLMGGLRNALHAYAVEGHRPAELAPRLARFAQSWGTPSMATYVYALLDPTEDSVTLVNGSHPQPLLVSPNGTAEFVSAPLIPPVGVPGPVLADEATIGLEPGQTLLFYTDGLVERRGTRLSERQDQLREAARGAAFDPDLLCETVLQAMGADGPLPDDVALLAVQRAASADRGLSLEIATRSEELAAIRRLLRAWLADAGADRQTISAVLLASGEACSNAMEHAYGPGNQTFELEAERDDESVVIRVRDRGRWRPPRGRNRGRGLSLMEKFMDDVKVDPSEAGTTVTMRRRLAD